jgi:hypothetical protein
MFLTLEVAYIECLVCMMHIKARLRGQKNNEQTSS